MQITTQRLKTTVMSQFLSSSLRNVPIAIGKNKFNAALQLIKKNKVDVLLFDDGFQTRKYTEI